MLICDACLVQIDRFELLQFRDMRQHLARETGFVAFSWNCRVEPKVA